MKRQRKERYCADYIEKIKRILDIGTGILSRFRKRAKTDQCFIDIKRQRLNKEVAVRQEKRVAADGDSGGPHSRAARPNAGPKKKHNDQHADKGERRSETTV
ncbi:MAG: hypothetical protein GF419_02110 [Ignavibacteriales bacterium]|nr:hypothetical protein [Ignavibacteriales bacterium]